MIRNKEQLIMTKAKRANGRLMLEGIVSFFNIKINASAKDTITKATIVPVSAVPLTRFLNWNLQVVK